MTSHLVGRWGRPVATTLMQAV